MDTLVKLTNTELKPFKTAFEKRVNAHKIDKIHAQTRDQIKQGFTFDGHTSSLSAAAQANWQALLGLYNADLFTDQHISTKDEGPYQLTKNKLKPFIHAAYNALNHALNSGRHKKANLNNL